jgi:adenylate cyclase
MVSIIYPAGAMILAFAAFQVYYILTSQRTTRFLTGAFSSFVSPDVVQALISQPDSLGLSGERREITLLFSDVRGFTTISEKLTPERLVEMLNKYFDAMTETILVRRGTLDKYIGDAVMAFFNAPIEIENHQHQAARSALAMIDKLNEMQPELKSEFDVEVKIGIGLHCGDAVVGNMGSTERFDYTAMGDTVNLAARAESITKMYGVDIIITGTMDEHLEDTFVRRPIDKIQVKGKTVPADIFQLMATTDENRVQAERFTGLYELYMDAKFEQAESGLKAMLDDYPGDGPSKVLLERCKIFLQDPPGDDWDGVFTATHK